MFWSISFKNHLNVSWGTVSVIKVSKSEKINQFKNVCKSTNEKIRIEIVCRILQKAPEAEWA